MTKSKTNLPKTTSTNKSLNTPLDPEKRLKDLNNLIYAAYNSPDPIAMALRVYLDDERTTPEGWVRVYWPNEAVELLETGAVIEISLDHDLGDDERGTGYDVVLWIEEAVALRGFVPPKISVHSANSSAREKMEAGIRAIEKLSTQNMLQKQLLF